MVSLGQYLRQLRARHTMSLEDIARTTRVAARYLEALESDDLAILPPPAFTRGFIRAYCQVLGESPEEPLALYDGRRDAAGSASAARVTPPAVPSTREPDAARSRSAVLVSFILLVVLGMALFAVTLMIRPARDDADRRDFDADRRVADAPSESPVPVRTAPPAPLPTILPPTAPAARPGPASSATVATGPTDSTTAGAARPRAGGVTQAGVRGPSPALNDLPEIVGVVTSPYRLVARTSEPTWVRVRMADGRIIEETVPAGQEREWVSNAPFVLTIGNAGGILLELNGRPLPSLGASGAVIARLVLPPER